MTLRELAKFFSTVGLDELGIALWNHVEAKKSNLEKAEDAASAFGIDLQNVNEGERGGNEKLDGREFFHRGTMSDIGVIHEIFLQQVYAVNKLRRGSEIEAIYEDIVSSGKQPLIIDAGANIGASAVWFSIKFPKSHLIAIEPEAENFSLLERNTINLDVDARNAAIGCQDGFVSILDPGEGAVGYRTLNSDTHGVERISLSRIVEVGMRAGRDPFIAKIDIEGGESDLFSQSTEWIAKFPLLIIELHDWLLPKSASSMNFLKAIPAVTEISSTWERISFPYVMIEKGGARAGFPDPLLILSGDHGGFIQTNACSPRRRSCWRLAEKRFS